MQHSCSNLPFDSSDRARRSWSQIWYGEDLGDRSEQDNAGETCVDVYATGFDLAEYCPEPQAVCSRPKP